MRSSLLYFPIGKTKGSSEIQLVILQMEGGPKFYRPRVRHAEAKLEGKGDVHVPRGSVKVRYKT